MKVVIIIPQEKFNNNEFNTVLKKLKENDILFDIASISKSTAYGYASFNIKPDITIDEINISNYNCVIIIGGSGNKKYLWKNPALHRILRIAAKQEILIAAICLAPICLIYSGIIRNSAITAYRTKETLKIIKESQNKYADYGVYTSHNIITANGPKVSLKFAEAIISKLKQKPVIKIKSK